MKKERIFIPLFLLILLFLSFTPCFISGTNVKYRVVIKVIDLDGSPVAHLNITAVLPNGTIVQSKETNSSGYVIFELVKGNYTFNALWHNLTVGSISSNVTKDSLFILNCDLVNVSFNVTNLLGEPLSGIIVEIYNSSQLDFPLEITETNKTGLTPQKLLLNGTSYVFRAFLNSIEIANKSHYLSSSSIILLTVNFAHLNVSVTDERGIGLPNINVRILWTWTNRTKHVRVEEKSVLTNSKGNAEFLNIPVNVPYQIELIREGVRFAKINFTDLKAILKNGWITLNVTCPYTKLYLQVSDSEGYPVDNAHVEIYSLTNGVLIGEDAANSSGWTSFTLLPGRYKAYVHAYCEVLQKNVTLGKLFLNLTGGLRIETVKSLGYNVTLTVHVIDRFGKPLPNVEIEISYYDMYVTSMRTKGDGTAEIHGLVKGNYIVSVLISGKLVEVKSIYLNGSREVTVKLERYIAIGNYPLEALQAINLLLTILIAVSFFIIMVFRKFNVLRHIREKLITPRS
ncbi:TPA: carboxypeptidase regulatory-like domain-containing protein [Candidatus Bathyarchaeota archaeon]|nr:carboxypeptidase regulatory-like domain-containing protein [Candidatus Bathyarchaeota archaeon]